MAHHRYKKLRNQTMVITGASSGTGLETAKRAAQAGARLVLVSRNESALRQICEDIRQNGGDAVYAVADVGNEEDVQGIVDVAQREYGGFDTWVNNAGVVIFSELTDLPLDEHQRLFLTNYWGTVHGSQAAVAHFRNRADGGTLINIASINSEMPVPILGAYSASKAAVKAYTEVLRMELQNENAPIKVSMLKPSGISTPISEHGRSHMPNRGKVMPPLYDVAIVADAILTAAQRPVRAMTVGETGKLSTLAWALAPSLMDRVIGWALPRAQASGEPRLPTDNLFEPGVDGNVYLEGKQQGLRISPYTEARLHSRLSLGLGVLAGAAFLAYKAQSRPR